METANGERYREKLEQEKNELEADLSKIGRINVSHPSDWELKPDNGADLAFRDEVADQMEEMEERGATEITLEKRLNNIKLALEKISSGKYGFCEVGGEPIEAERLEANPAARTCKTHLSHGADANLE